ncbi:hypothetical protein EVC27_056 [Rhizobium phage RHph_I1_6]|uniref:Uncharacterized protein n=1 Tax=Rhizobium phage RHph_I1_6 TaxID=2509728 RepID=A0A7S5V1F8_9CAUD|nr:hypothetical protein PP745_gp056 [Rhizobium phage RHph_I1_6]QIG76581.1 hypothetical protein EVC27_056 [Rhizobium phage RHph_I1_6]
MVLRTINPQYFINLVLSELVTPDENRLKALSMKLVQKNAALGMAPDGFFYKGRVFYNVEPKLYAGASKGNLHPSLYEEGDLLVRQYDKVAKDADRIRQFLALSFISINVNAIKQWSLQDLRDVLCEGVIDLIPELRELPRTRPEGYCVSPEHREQWEKRKAIVEEYIAMRFFI